MLSQQDNLHNNDPTSRWTQLTNFSNASFMSVRDSISTNISGFKAMIPKMTRKQKITWSIIGFILVVIFVLITIYHHKIVAFLKPLSQKIRHLPFGWLIPIVVLVIISFPPLVGHEIVALLCGVVYGFWMGSLIVVAGSFLGEVANFFVFRYYCGAKSDKLMKTNLSYATLAKVVIDGGLFIIVLVRLSAIPGHLTTPLFASLRQVSFTIYCLGAILSMPKNMIPVYFGVIFSHEKGNPVSTVMLVLTLLITIAIGLYIHCKLVKTRPLVIAEWRSRGINIIEGEEIIMPIGQTDEQVSIMHMNKKISSNIRYKKYQNGNGIETELKPNSFAFGCRGIQRDNYSSRSRFMRMDSDLPLVSIEGEIIDMKTMGTYGKRYSKESNGSSISYKSSESGSTSGTSGHASIKEDIPLIPPTLRRSRHFIEGYSEEYQNYNILNIPMDVRINEHSNQLPANSNININSNLNLLHSNLNSNQLPANSNININSNLNLLHSNSNSNQLPANLNINLDINSNSNPDQLHANPNSNLNQMHRQSNSNHLHPQSNSNHSDFNFLDPSMANNGRKIK